MEKTTFMKKALDVVWEYTKVIGGALILASVVRSTWFEPFKIPSTSMVPTLLVGDFLFVDKNNYGWRNPCTGERFRGEDPQRGDVIVFEEKKGIGCGLVLGLGSLNYIKRIVAVPGDTVAYRNKTLYVNGEAAHVTYEQEYSYEGSQGELHRSKQYGVDFSGIHHKVMLNDQVASMDLEEAVVPEGHYVVMGDNRDNSLDSRYWNYPDWGFVAKEDIVGQAKMLFWSWDKNLMPRFDRLGGSLVSPAIEGK